MSDRADFIRAICEAPSDSAPRLVYADWLDEHGDTEDRARAELIRVQCELAGLGDGRLSAAKERRRTSLRKRQTELLTDCEWFAGGFGRRVWLGDAAERSDEANRIERVEGHKAADAYAAKEGGLRWIRDGAEGKVLVSGVWFSKVAVADAGESFKIGIVSNVLLAAVSAPVWICPGIPGVR